MLQAAVSVWPFPARTGCCVPPLPSTRETVRHKAAAMTPETGWKPCYFGNTGKPEHPFSLPPELLQNRVSHFAGRASQHLVCTVPTGGSGLCFWLPRISCPSQGSSIFHSVATHLVLCPALVVLQVLVALVLLYLALVLWVKGRRACRTCWSCLGCDVRASFPSLSSLSSRLTYTFSSSDSSLHTRRPVVHCCFSGCHPAPCCPGLIATGQWTQYWLCPCPNKQCLCRVSVSTLCLWHCFSGKSCSCC